MSEHKPSAAAMRAAEVLWRRNATIFTNRLPAITRKQVASIIDAEFAPVVEAHGRLLRWLEQLEDIGVAGRFIATREIREVLEGK